MRISNVNSIKPTVNNRLQSLDSDFAAFRKETLNMPKPTTECLWRVIHITLIFYYFYAILYETFFQPLETIDIYAQNTGCADRTLP